MSTYFIGDIHGCYKNLKTILTKIRFDPSIDMLYLTGDLVSRGPKSLEVLRWVKSFTNKVKTVLGNHDLHLLAAYFGINYKNFKNSFNSILNAPDIDELMYWLRHQSILHIDEDRRFLLIHAGIHPSWNLNQLKLYAQEIEKILISNNPHLLFCDSNQLLQLKKMNINITDIKQIQKNVNIFTKIRYVHLNGSLDFTYKDIPENTPKNIYPWFKSLKNIRSDYKIIFGHWASLKNWHIPRGFYGLDSGCCWGGNLTVLRWEDKKITHVSCDPPA